MVAKHTQVRKFGVEDYTSFFVLLNLLQIHLEILNLNLKRFLDFVMNQVLERQDCIEDMSIFQPCGRKTQPVFRVVVI